MCYDKLLKEMGARINARRRELKMTQETLAEKMDVSVQMISNLELGKKAIRPENIIKLCEAISVSSDYILMGKHPLGDIGVTIDGYNKLTPDQQKLINKIIEEIIRK
ncbi:MAG: helix-turn-helix transcriptional regulator [Clostridia bacterium]|nr:helix-turn-helix transcriptional regulator [Clostridia bacterium]